MSAITNAQLWKGLLTRGTDLDLGIRSVRKAAVDVAAASRAVLADKTEARFAALNRAMDRYAVAVSSLSDVAAKCSAELKRGDALKRGAE